MELDLGQRAGRFEFEGLRLHITDAWKVQTNVRFDWMSVQNLLGIGFLPGTLGGFVAALSSELADSRNGPSNGPTDT